ncbi:hypothetical protein LLG07_06070 [bacterium]|nr:hypothetical protein [bacterium]
MENTRNKKQLSIYITGIVSFFNDMASEIIYPPGCNHVIILEDYRNK